MRARSIRFRLTLWYTLALVIGLLLFAVAIWLAMARSLSRDIDQRLDAQVKSTQAFLSEELKDPHVKLPEELSEYALALPKGTLLKVTDSDGVVVHASAAPFPWRYAPAGREVPVTLSWNGHEYRALTRDIRLYGGLWGISCAISREGVLQLLARLRWLLVTLLPAVACVASLGGLWLSRRALRPVDEITTAARQIGIQNLSRRLMVPQTGDELQRLSETWNDMLSRLEDAVGRLSRFTADASHELRTPLAVIRSTAEIAARRARSAESYREALEHIALESEKMTGLVEDLMFLARRDSESLELPMESLALDALIEDVLFLMKPLADRKGVSLEAAPLPANTAMFGNRSAIRRLLLALIDNAIKYTDPGGRVRLSLECTRDLANFRVGDNGPGIPEADLPFLFQRFYRGSSGRHNGNTGFGLGLALASGIAEYHGSELKVRSVVGQGSEFSVSFPLAGDTSQT
jgi:two-component system, OmpR family, heavy metal sensor histidine kinase CusS